MRYGVRLITIKTCALYGEGPGRVKRNSDFVSRQAHGFESEKPAVAAERTLVGQGGQTLADDDGFNRAVVNDLGRSRRGPVEQVGGGFRGEGDIGGGFEMRKAQVERTLGDAEGGQVGVGAFRLES